MERHESPESQWVTACLDLPTPPAAWEPNLGAARTRIAARSGARLRRRSTLRRYFLVGAMATMIVCVAIPAIPQAWVLAQQAGNSGWQRLEQLWYRFTLVRAGPMLLGHLPDSMKSLHTQPLGEPVFPTPSQARRKLDCAPALLHDCRIPAFFPPHPICQSMAQCHSYRRPGTGPDSLCRLAQE